MIKINYTFLQETVYQSTLPNGLSLVVIPKRGYAKVYSIFATKFGSYSSKFSTNGETFSLPLGLAHFLEHQLFESDGDVDITNQFALLGAECNAYTNYQETAYITSSSTKNEEVINLLLDYVQNPHFTAESIKEEQGIIEQERVMYLDKPGVRVHMGLLKNLYFNHPVREDIVGTKESIVAINDADMRKAYETFYHPSNMMLVIVGDVDPNVMEQLVVVNQSKKAFVPRRIPQTIIPDEPLEVVRRIGEEAMDIKMPKAVVGLKLPPLSRFNHSMIEVEAMLRIIQEYYFGASSPLYQELIDSELFSTSYSNNFFIDQTCGYLYISANTKKPKEFVTRIEQALLELTLSSIDTDSFDKIHKAIIGSMIKSLNSLESIAHNVVEYMFMGEDLFSGFSSIQQMKKDDLLPLQSFFIEQAISTYIINPLSSSLSQNDSFFQNEEKNNQ